MARGVTTALFFMHSCLADIKFRAEQMGVDSLNCLLYLIAEIVTQGRLIACSDASEREADAVGED